MASKICEIRVFKDGREVRGMQPFLTSVDLTEGESTANTLNRHLLGAALRDGSNRRDLHRYHLEFRDIDSDGKGFGRALRWVMPAAEDA